MFIASGLTSCAANMAGYLACCTMGNITKAVMKRSSRVAYSFLFFLAIITSWLFRDFARPLLEKIPCEHKGCGAGMAQNADLQHARRSSIRVLSCKFVVCAIT